MAYKQDYASGEFDRAFDRVKISVYRAEQLFKGREALVAIAAACTSTLSWLKDNRESYDADGACQLTPWWPHRPTTENEILADAREYMLRCRLHENGLRHLLAELIHSGLITPNSWEFLNKGITYQTMGLHYELLGLRQVNGDTLSLASISKRFDYQNASKLRDKMFIGMANFGLWEIRENGGWAISLGRVAEEFHTKVFIPTFRQRITTLKKGA